MEARLLKSDETVIRLLAYGDEFEDAKYQPYGVITFKKVKTRKSPGLEVKADLPRWCGALRQDECQERVCS